MKFNNVGLDLSMALKFQTSVAKGLIIKVYVRRRYKGKKLVQKDGGGAGDGAGAFCPLTLSPFSSLIGLIIISIVLAVNY